MSRLLQTVDVSPLPDPLPDPLPGPLPGPAPEPAPNPLPEPTPEPAPGATAPGTPPTPEPPAPEPPPPSLPLARLGFGDGMLARLNQLGIHDTADLAATAPASLREALGEISRLVDVDAWVAHARASLARSVTYPMQARSIRIGGTVMHRITFGAADIENRLAGLSAEELDKIAFGIVQVDRNGTILAFNAVESSITGHDRVAVIGKNFFTDVASCTDVTGFRGKFDTGVRAGDLNVVFEWHLGEDTAPIVQVHMKKAARDGVFWIFTKRL